MCRVWANVASTTPSLSTRCTIDAAWAVGRSVVAVSVSAVTGRSAVLFVTYYFTIFHIFFDIIFIIPFIPVATMPQTHGHDHNIIAFSEQRPALDDEYNNINVRGGGKAGGHCSRTNKKNKYFCKSVGVCAR